jgi:adenylate cyclase
MGRDESGTLAALKTLRQEVVDKAIASNGGRIVKTTGDGLLLEFPSVVNAVKCAVEVQTATADRTASIDEDRRIAFALVSTSGTSSSRPDTVGRRPRADSGRSWQP